MKNPEEYLNGHEPTESELKMEETKRKQYYISSKELPKEIKE